MFRFDAPIDRSRFLRVGVGLLILEYVLEASVVRVATGATFPPWRFLVPVWTVRTATFADAPPWVFAILALVTLPFFFVGLSYCVRRSIDAGYSPYLGLGFALPVWNLVTIGVLALSPTRPRGEAVGEASAAPAAGASSTLRAATITAVASAAIGIATAALAGQVLDAYGASLFFATPLVMGVFAGHLVNRERDVGLGATIGVALLTLAITAGGLLLFALEGLVCLAMVAPLAAVVACFGAVLGRAFALHRYRPTWRSSALVFALPFAALSERAVDPPHLHEVVSSVVVDAPPEVVFQHVVAFTELPEPTEWIFRTGVAYPRRARIEGHGVGAIRRCEFSTGAFVEPITRWEPPTRLSFDVASQPPPMHERTFYRAIHPPHLDSMMRSRRGEFRLTRLDDGRTRLEGTTWYELRAAPDLYFRFVSDAIVHDIHLRVLRHVKSLAETSPSAPRADARRPLSPTR